MVTVYGQNGKIIDLLVNIEENEHDVLINRAHLILYGHNVMRFPT